MKRISIFGLGYVGAVTAACFAREGHSIIGVDLNPRKVELLNAGRAPVLEPGLEQLVAQNHKDGRLQATTRVASAVSETEISFVCVGTPSLHNGRLDLSSIKNVCGEIGRALREKSSFHWIVLRSTMLPGTAADTVIPTIEAASGKYAGRDFAVCVNPEFTREGSAVADFVNSPLTVVGTADPEHARPLSEIYRNIAQHIFETSLEVAEMVKYVCNAFHALKVTFANEVGTLCRRLNLDDDAVMKIFVGDHKLNISAAYLNPGFSFGGSCLPKDLRAISYCAKQLDLDLPVLQAINPSNQAHLERAVATLLATQRKKISILGLSFKSGTDDLRESPSVQLIKRLLGEGRHVRIWDPDVSLGRLMGSNHQFIEEEIPHIGSLLSADLDSVISGAEVVVVVIETFSLDELLALCTPAQMIVDLRSPDPTPVLVASMNLDCNGQGVVNPRQYVVAH